ncbi:MAG: hypothetical protein M1818_004456 [Claussenomyces sp. TS43310]|nr:MAG: hypothetical protein M1818_004456 [Claussenomyces sp. TS43310]
MPQDALTQKGNFQLGHAEFRVILETLSTSVYKKSLPSKDLIANLRPWKYRFVCQRLPSTAYNHKLIKNLHSIQAPSTAESADDQEGLSPSKGQVQAGEEFFG